LRSNGFHANAGEEGLTVSPNDKLYELFKANGIVTGDIYVPADLTAEQWADHEGAHVPTFKSLPHFLSSEWCARFFHGTIPLGEGVVLNSAWDGRQFKLKHGGEECGNLPTKVDEAI